jgi:hypothetical protein
LLEWAAYVAGEPWSDTPACVSPVLGVFGRNINDVLGDDKRQELKRFVPSSAAELANATPEQRAGWILGTAGDGLDEQRSYMALDWLIRTWTPTWLDLAGLTAEAQTLRDLRRIVDLVAAQQAGPVVRAAGEKATERRAAAWAAAGDAAWAAAGDAAWDAAGAAAWAAAGAAAGDAAGAAAGDAAWDVLNPTVAALQDSAIALFATMIRPEIESAEADRKAAAT